MPIVDITPPEIGTPITTPKGFAVTPGAVDVAQGQDAVIERPSWSDTFSAAFRSDNTVGSYLASETKSSPRYIEPDFKPWDAIKGTKYESNWDSFVNIRNTAHAEDMKRQIDREEEDRKLLSSAAWYQSIPAQLAAGVIDLPTLLPGGAFVRGAKGGFSIARSAATVGLAAGVGTLAQEAALQETQATRPLSESAINLGASVFLGGLLGAGGAKLLSAVEWNKAVKALESDLVTSAEKQMAAISPEVNVTAPASVGAAANAPTDLGLNTIAGTTAGAVAAATKKLNPGLRLMQSESAVSREVGSQLFEFTPYLEKHFQGITSAPAVETLMKEYNAGLAKAIETTSGTFSEYRKAGGALGWDEFRDAVGKAMRRGDVGDDPAVTKVAQEWRARVFDPLKDAAIKAKLLPEDVSVDTAASYFSRMWNRNKLIAREGEFKGIVADYYNKRLVKEFSESSASHAGQLARIDQEIADLNIPADQRVGSLHSVEQQIIEHEAQWPSLAAAADDLSDIRGRMLEARRAGNDAEVEKLKVESKAIHAQFPKDALAAFIKTRAELRARRRNIDLSAAGLQERSARIADAMVETADANFRSMERLVKKGQKLERDLDRLDADALDARVQQMADGYGAIARRAEASAGRAERTIENIRKGTQAATTAKRAAADEAIAKRLEIEAQRQRVMAEQMDSLAERLKAAREFDHDGLMAELRGGVERAMRIASSSSMERGARVARLSERMAALDPARVTERVKVLNNMKGELDNKFIERWEVGRGAIDVNPATRSAKFSEVAKQIADEVFNTLTGKISEGVRPEFITIKSRGPMKERTFHIPDALVEPFLESDVAHVGSRYTRVMGADVEVANRFGSVDMADQIAQVREDYKRMRADVTDEKTLKRLGKAEEADIRDLEALRDQLRGTRNESPIEQNYAKIVRSVNHFNYLRTMGEVALASLAETVRPAMVHGLIPYMQTFGQVLTNLKAIKMSVAEAKLAGNIVESVLQQRLATLADIMDPYASRGPVEAFLEKMTNIASKWNGIRMLTDMQKSISAVMTQDRILKGVANYAGIKQKEKAYLALLHIDESMAGRIAAQFNAHGEVAGGVRVANTENWTDDVAKRTYRAAMNKDIDSIITTKGVADSPLFSNTPTGRMLLQFQGYGLASHQRVLLRGLQESQARFIGGIVAMTAIGMLATYLKGVSGNREGKLADFPTNPGWWIGEGLDKAGIFSVPMQLANMFEKGAGFNPIKSPIKAFDEGNTLSQRTSNRSSVGTLLGPTVGLGDDVMTALGVPSAMMTEGKEVTQAQKNAAERLMPFNSYFGIRQMMRYVVNPQE